MPANKMKSKPSILLYFSVSSVVQIALTQSTTKALSSPASAGLQKLCHVIEQSGPLNGGGHDDVNNRERYQELPAKTHQLIEAKPRQSSAEPDIEEKKHRDLAEKIKSPEPRQLMDERQGRDVSFL